MTSVINDASCLIDLHKVRLLPVMLGLPYRFVVPLPIRRVEALDLTHQDWRRLDELGLVTFDLPSERVADALRLRSRHPKLSANDCFCLVSAQCHDGGMLLTGDQLLRQVATKAGGTRAWRAVGRGRTSPTRRMQRRPVDLRARTLA